MDEFAIRTFITVAETDSFSSAADALHVSQSTVSNRIKVLEEEVGSELIIRDKSGIRLTPSGVVFLDYARRMEAVRESALKHIHHVRLYNESVKFASAQWIYDTFLIPRLDIFVRECPNTSLNHDIDYKYRIIPKLRHGEYDCAFISNKVSSANLTSIPFASCKVKLVASSERYSDFSKGIVFSDLTRLPVIYTNILERIAVFKDSFDDQFFSVKCASFLSAKNYCIAGAGFCFLPESIVEKEIADGILVEIPVEGYDEETVNAYFVYNKNKTHSEAFKRFMDIMLPSGYRKIE